MDVEYELSKLRRKVEISNLYEQIIWALPYVLRDLFNVPIGSLSGKSRSFTYSSNYTNQRNMKIAKRALRISFNVRESSDFWITSYKNGQWRVTVSPEEENDHIV